MQEIEPKYTTIQTSISNASKDLAGKWINFRKSEISFEIPAELKQKEKLVDRNQKNKNNKKKCKKRFLTAATTQ